MVNHARNVSHRQADAQLRGEIEAVDVAQVARIRPLSRQELETGAEVGKLAPTGVLFIGARAESDLPTAKWSWRSEPAPAAVTDRSRSRWRRSRNRTDAVCPRLLAVTLPVLATDVSDQGLFTCK